MAKTFPVLAAGLLILFVAALVHGDFDVSLADLLALLLGDPDVEPGLSMIVLDLRLPRVLLAFMVGVALAVAGAITQSVLRNPLAEPGLLGINGGAALAALLVIVHLRPDAVHLVPLAAFAGALAAALAVFGLSAGQGTSSIRIILIGIGISALTAAGASFLTAFGEVTDVQRAMVWLAGSFNHAGWSGVRMLASWLALPLAITWMLSRELDLIRFGEDIARGLGQRVSLVRAVMILLCTLLAGAAVAAAGPVAFVGLIAPHMARQLVGDGHARLLPAAALLGGGLVVTADLLGRSVIAPAQLPAGLVTALIGGPFFAYLLWRRSNAHG